MHGDANSSCVLRDDGCLLQGVVDSLYGVLTHREEEAGAHLWLRRTRVEQGGRRMSEPLFAHQVVGLKSRLKVVNVNTDGTAHEHVLGALNNLVVALEQVGSLEGLEAEEVVVEVTVVIDHGVDAFMVFRDDVVDILGEEGSFSSLTVSVVVEQIGSLEHARAGTVVEGLDSDVVRQLGVVWVHDGHVGARFGAQVRDLLSRHT